MCIAIGIDTELAAPALAAEFGEGRSSIWHEPPAAPDAPYTIRPDVVHAEAPQQLRRLPQVRRVLWSEDDPSCQPDSASHQLPYPCNGALEAARLARDLVVDEWIERVEGKVDEHSQVFECLNEIVSEPRRVREDFATLEPDARRVPEKPPQIRMDGGLTTDELQPPTAQGAGFIHHMAPVGKVHPLGKREIGT